MTSASTAPLYRWMYYDGSGRMAGYKQGHWVSFPGNMAWAITGTACRYDADGQLYLPCDNGAPQLSFDGSNVIGTNTKWRFIHAPGVDEPLMAGYENQFGTWLRELYFVTDGQGRQLSVGDKKGYIHEGDFSTDGSGRDRERCQGCDSTLGREARHAVAEATGPSTFDLLT